MGGCVLLLHALQDFVNLHQRLELLLLVVQVCEVLCQKVGLLDIRHGPLPADGTRHPKIIEDEKAVEIILRLEETKQSNEESTGGGRRLTVTAVGSRLSADLHKASTASMSIIGPNIARPSKVLVNPHGAHDDSIASKDFAINAMYAY
jgi:hypothetical protein